MRKPITPEEKVAIELRFPVTGKSYKSLIYQYCVSNSNISKFIRVECKIISKVFYDTYL